jgi:hypothetical protein
LLQRSRFLAIARNDKKRRFALFLIFEVYRIISSFCKRLDREYFSALVALVALVALLAQNGAAQEPIV